MSSVNVASTNKDHIRAHRRKGRENIFLDCRKFLMITISIDIRLDSVVSIAMLTLCRWGLRGKDEYWLCSYIKKKIVHKLFGKDFFVCSREQIVYIMKCRNHYNDVKLAYRLIVLKTTRTVHKSGYMELHMHVG